jgi:hypothetical protein
VLRLGAAGLVSLAVSSTASACRAIGDDGAQPATTRPPVRTAPRVEPTPSVRAGATFAGRPAPGTLFYGASVPRHKPLAPWEDTLGSRLSLHRSYFTPDRNETGQLVKRCHADLLAGRMPHVSIKPADWTWAEIAEGRHDAWLAELVDGLAAEAAPVFLTVHHEPENDSGPPGMAAADFVAMQEHVIAAAAERAPLVTVVPVLQSWTFDPLQDDGTDPHAWVVGGASVLGLDIYNPWSPTNGKAWRSLGSKASEVLGFFGDVPLLVGEYGCRVDPDNPGLAAEWMRDAADFAREHGFVSMSYFNSHVNSPDGTWALSGETEEAFAELLAADWVARLP